MNIQVSLAATDSRFGPDDDRCGPACEIDLERERCWADRCPLGNKPEPGKVTEVH